MIQRAHVVVNTTGAAGSAQGSGSVRINGKILSVHINYHASAPATTDISLKTDSPEDTIVTKNDSNTDAWYHPRHPVTDNAGTELLYAASGEAVAEPYVSYGNVTLAVTGCDPLTAAVRATILFEGEG